MKESRKASAAGKRLEVVLPQNNSQVSIPPYFRCPISLDLMRDPVSLCTGVSYDRASIEKWLSDGNCTCPATMQVLDNQDLIPNTTLRRLIQEWCVANALKGVERIPTPKQPAEPQQLKQLVTDIKEGFTQVETLRMARNLARESATNRRYLLDGGVISALSSVLSDDGPSDHEPSDACEEALGLLLDFSNSDRIRELTTDAQLLNRICWFLSRGKLESKIQAANIVEQLCLVDEEVKLKIGSTDGVMKSLLCLSIIPDAVHASLTCLLALCSPRRIRVKAIKEGAVLTLMELLSDADRGITERAMAVLELLCVCADGRAAVAKLPTAIPLLVNTLLRVSQLATERTVAVLWSVLHYSPEKKILRESVQAGLFSKLFLLVQSECSQSTKKQATELLKLLRHVWQEFPCIPNEHGLTSHGLVIPISFINT